MSVTEPSETQSTEAGPLNDISWTDTLWLNADPKDITEEERIEAEKAITSAIAHRIHENGYCRLRVFGVYAAHEADCALAVARSILAAHGYELYWFACVICSEEDGRQRAGLGYVTALDES